MNIAILTKICSRRKLHYKTPKRRLRRTSSIHSRMLKAIVAKRSANRSIDRQKQHVKRREKATTRSLMTASFAYLSLNCPHYVWSVIRSTELFNDLGTLYLVDEILQMILVSQYLLHSLIYGRMNLTKTLCRLRNKAEPSLVAGSVALTTNSNRACYNHGTDSPDTRSKITTTLSAPPQHVRRKISTV